MSETNGNGNGSGGQNGSTIEIEPTGKWQVYWVNADGLRTMPASPPGSFRGAVAFCRGWTAGAIRNGLGQIREGLFPVPFKIENEAKSAGSIMDVVNGHPSRQERRSRDCLVGPALNMQAPPLADTKLDSLNRELSKDEDCFYEPY